MSRAQDGDSMMRKSSNDVESKHRRGNRDEVHCSDDRREKETSDDPQLIDHRGYHRGDSQCLEVLKEERKTSDDLEQLDHRGNRSGNS